VSLRGAHALVTGGGRGIGAAIATALAAAGARLTLLGRDRAALDAHAAALPASAEAFVVTADVTDADEVGAAFTLAAGRHGDVGVLVNNAGIASSGPFAKLDPAEWERILRGNLSGTYNCTRAAVPAMLAARAGRIVNVASTAGLVGRPYVSAYTAAKHGVIGLTRALAAELAPQGVTVNAVCPGFTESALLERTLENIVALTGRSRDAAARTLLERNPLGRFVRPEEVANAVVWLCGDAAAAVTGQAIVIDGGEVTP
jgi:NAD(P)-dependent dehydrogenase (short-subunit alcohol dehydrogenase family)